MIENIKKFLGIETKKEKQEKKRRIRLQAETMAKVRMMRLEHENKMNQMTEDRKMSIHIQDAARDKFEQFHHMDGSEKENFGIYVPRKMPPMYTLYDKETAKYADKSIREYVHDKYLKLVKEAKSMPRLPEYLPEYLKTENNE